MEVGGGSGATGSPREDRRSPRGAVYRISQDGVWDQLWESRDDSPYDLTFDQNGNLYDAHELSGTVNKILPGGIEVPFVSGLDLPRGGTIDVSAPLPPHMVQSWNLLGFDAARYDPIETAPEE